MYANQSPRGGGGGPAMVAITTFLLAALFVIVSGALGSWFGVGNSGSSSTAPQEAGIPVTGGNAVAPSIQNGPSEPQSGTGGSSEFITYPVLYGDTLGEIAARYSTTVAEILLHNPQIDDPDRVRPGDTIYLPSGLSVPVTGSPAQVAIAPSNGPPGTAVSVYGHGFPYGVQFNLSIGAAGAPPALRHPLTANQAGVMIAQVVIPAGAAPGETWLFQVAGGPEENMASATFQVIAPDPGTITVQPGDHLAEIAARHGVALRDVLIANPGITDPRGIVPGMVIAIPQPSPPEAPVIPDTGQTSPRTYTVRLGDTLGAIAQKFGITVDQILALNPEIQDPNRIFPGWVVTLP